MSVNGSAPLGSGRYIILAAGTSLAALNLSTLAFRTGAATGAESAIVIAAALFHLMNLLCSVFPQHWRYASLLIVCAGIAEILVIAVSGVHDPSLSVQLAFLTPAVALALSGPKAAAASLAVAAAAVIMQIDKLADAPGTLSQSQPVVAILFPIFVAAIAASFFTSLGNYVRLTRASAEYPNQNREEQPLPTHVSDNSSCLILTASDGASSIAPSALDLIHCGVAIIESDGTIVAANETAFRLADLKPGDRLSDEAPLTWRRADGSIVAFADAPAAEALAGRPGRPAEFRIQGSDGATRPICAVAAPIADATLRGHGAVLFMRDDSRRIGQEHELRWRRELLEHILEIVPVAVWITDQDHRILKINDLAAKLFGLERHLAIGAHVRDVMSGFKEEIHAPAASVDPNDDNSPAILEFQTGDGEKVYCRLARTQFMDPQADATYILSAATDITAVKRAKDRLSRANAELDQFARAVSHDLQEPLRKLIIFSEFLDKDLAGQDFESAKVDLDAIRTSALRMRQLVSDLLGLARAQADEISLADVEPAHCIKAAISSLPQLATDPSPSFLFDILPPVRADATLLTQVYQNLISNALKFAPPDVAPEIRFTAEHCGGKIVLGVRDNGEGVPAEHRRRIFDPLVRLHRRDHVEGAGIGLAICEKAVVRLGGEIWVEPVSPNGAHFRFSLAAARCGQRAA